MSLLLIPASPLILQAMVSPPLVLPGVVSLSLMPPIVLSLSLVPPVVVSLSPVPPVAVSLVPPIAVSLSPVLPVAVSLSLVPPAAVSLSLVLPVTVSLSYMLPFVVSQSLLHHRISPGSCYAETRGFTPVSRSYMPRLFSILCLWHGVVRETCLRLSAILHRSCVMLLNSCLIIRGDSGLPYLIRVHCTNLFNLAVLMGFMPRWPVNIAIRIMQACLSRNMMLHHAFYAHWYSMLCMPVRIHCWLMRTLSTAKPQLSSLYNLCHLCPMALMLNWGFLLIELQCFSMILCFRSHIPPRFHVSFPSPGFHNMWC